MAHAPEQLLGSRDHPARSKSLDAAMTPRPCNRDLRHLPMLKFRSVVGAVVLLGCRCPGGSACLPGHRDASRYRPQCRLEPPGATGVLTVSGLSEFPDHMCDRDQDDPDEGREGVREVSTAGVRAREALAEEATDDEDGVDDRVLGEVGLEALGAGIEQQPNPAEDAVERGAHREVGGGEREDGATTEIGLVCVRVHVRGVEGAVRDRVAGPVGSTGPPRTVPCALPPSWYWPPNPQDAWHAGC